MNRPSRRGSTRFGKAAVLSLAAVLAILFVRANRSPALQAGAGTRARPSAAPGK